MVFFLRNPNLRSMDIKFIYLKSVVLQDILYFSTCSLQCIYYNNSNVLNYYNTILYCTIQYYYTWLLSLPVHSVLCRIIIRWRRIILTGMRGNEVLASSSHSISISGKGSVGRSRILRCRSCGNHIHRNRARAKDRISSKQGRSRRTNIILSMDTCRLQCRV